ncbi:MAG: hypothetical protein J6C23_07440 [Clostridia bacterium]|nr:hypothetical protein [Clostridia bacterium]
MKKFLTLALCLLIALCSVGCTFTPTSNLTMDGTQPWAIYSGYERCEYKVTKKSADGTILGEGVLVNTVLIHTEANKPEETNTDSAELGIFTTIKSEFSFTTADTLTPITDYITSSSTFLTSSCAAIKSEKTVTLNSNPDLSYRFVADYEHKKVEYYAKNSSEITKTLTVPDSEKVIFDNEALYCITRAFNPQEEKEGNFLLTNLYDCYLDNRISSYSVYFRAADTYATQELFNESNRTLTWNLLTQNSDIVDNKIECYLAKINRNRSNMSGSPIEMWFTKTPFKGGKKRVMVKMRSTILTIPSAHVDYTTDYDLISYSITQ